VATGGGFTGLVFLQIENGAVDHCDACNM
jgi:hypothetical protein